MNVPCLSCQRVLTAVWLVSGALAVALPAGAQSGARASAPTAAPAPDTRAANVVEAERLFNEATAHMDEKRYEIARPLLEQSHALDPSSGTLLNLGDCYEQLGATGSAYRAFEEAQRLAEQTNKADRARVADIRKQRLTSLLRRFRITLAAGHPPNLVLRMDGTPLEASSLGGELIVDPGAHEIVAGAPGFTEYRARVEAPGPGEVAPVSIPPLVPLSAPQGEATTGAKSLSTHEVAAIASGAVGAAGVVVGAIFGLRSLSKHEESDDYCSGNVCHDRRGVELMNDARSAGNVSTIAFVIGGVALGTAGALWFVPFPGEASTAPRVGLGAGALHVRGVW